MKMIRIEAEEIIKPFLENNVIYNSAERREIHNLIIENIKNNKYEIDGNNDIHCAGYWITTNFSISQFNKNNDFSINIVYNVHKGSKYNEIMFKIER